MLPFRHLEVVGFPLGVPHRHVGDRHGAARAGDQDIANPQVDRVDLPALDRSPRCLSRAVLGHGPLIQTLP
jgi:hypothetical protein